MSDINPYSPYKIFCHHKNWQDVYGWYRVMNQGNAYRLAAPITVSVDLAAQCNMKCIGCNADFLLDHSAKSHLSTTYLDKLAIALGQWGVKGVCVGGGGESTMNPGYHSFIDKLKNNNVKVGIISNGIKLVNSPSIRRLDWAGVSVDAGTEKVWSEVHGISGRYYWEVKNNIIDLVNEGVDVTYKYLIRPENVSDVLNGIATADQCGCKSFHIRPMAIPWFEDAKSIFTQSDVSSVSAQLEEGKRLYPNVKVIGVFNKLGDQWQVTHPFDKCWAIFATCVFLANYKVGLCCDLRGCSTVEVGPFADPVDFINKFWGSKEHKNMQDKIDVNKCSRCTFSMLNQYFEQAIIQDRLMPDFI